MSPVGREFLPADCYFVIRLSLRRRLQGPHRVGAAQLGGQGAAQRQPQHETAAFADLALHGDVAAMLAQDLAADGESKPGALGALGAETIDQGSLGFVSGAGRTQPPRGRRAAR